MSAHTRYYYIQDYEGNYYKPLKTKLIQVRSCNEAMELTYDAAERWVLMSKYKEQLRIVDVEDVSLPSENIQEESQEVYPTQELPDDWISYMDGIDWELYLDDLIFIYENLEAYLHELQSRESFHDRKSSDILHYIELYEIQDSEYRMLVDMLARIRNDRRAVKNRIHCVEAVLRTLSAKDVLQRAYCEQNIMNGLHKQKYVPRELPELFEGAVKRSDEDMAVWSLPGERNWDDGEYQLEQHGEMHDLQAKIEDLLLEIEDSKYNLAQAYRVYTELKALRREMAGKDVEEEGCRLIS